MVLNEIGCSLLHMARGETDLVGANLQVGPTAPRAQLKLRPYDWPVKSLVDDH
jgi:hypothetical protein